jgi:caffeoyl-CoA O-methyltransferase
VGEIVPDEIELYAEEHSTPEPSYLKALTQEARATLGSPEMLSGPVNGRLLETLAFATGARRILEIGTFAGYSALWLAGVLPPDGGLITCEVDPEHAAFARRHIESSPFADRIELRLGPALETVRGLAGPFDLVFIDADKGGYPDYYEASLPLLSDRGLIVVDNTLQGGDVLEERSTAASTVAMRKFNDMLRDDPRVACVLLTVRDGITLIRKRQL